jgi:hypothetical protein
VERKIETLEDAVIAMREYSKGAYLKLYADGSGGIYPSSDSVSGVSFFIKPLNTDWLRRASGEIREGLIFEDGKPAAVGFRAPEK